jgi:hypothetical protein
MRNTSGAQGRNRTTDTMIFSHVLYQLSYLGAGPWRSAAGPNGGAFIESRAGPVQTRA